MVFIKRFAIIFLTAFLLACGAGEKLSTPLETLKAYTQAIKKKDTTAMKLLLSDASLKMAEQEGKAQGRTLDDVVKNETLFSESQKQLKFRNEKIDGDRATIEVENSFGSWDAVPFVKEEGTWKIDKQALFNQVIEENDAKQKEMFDKINQGRIPQ